MGPVGRMGRMGVAVPPALQRLRLHSRFLTDQRPRQGAQNPKVLAAHALAAPPA